MMEVEFELIRNAMNGSRTDEHDGRELQGVSLGCAEVGAEKEKESRR